MLITQDNLTIRNAVSADASLFGSWWRDGKVMAHAGFPLGLSVTDEEIAMDLAKDDDRVSRRLVIEVDSRPIGEMSYCNIGEGTAEIGIKICDFAEQGKGYGIRFLRMLVDNLFAQLHYEKIILDTNLDNKRAQYVYEKLGFQKIGVRYDCWKNQLGEWQSAVDYELLRANWIGGEE